MTATIRSLYPLALLEEQGMGTAYEYYSKLRVVQAAFSAAHGTADGPHSLLVLGLPEKHGYDLDLLLVAQQARATLTLCEDRPDVLSKLPIHDLPISCRGRILVKQGRTTQCQNAGKVQKRLFFGPGFVQSLS